jgi:hypothetical protein
MHPAAIGVACLLGLALVAAVGVIRSEHSVLAADALMRAARERGAVDPQDIAALERLESSGTGVLPPRALLAAAALRGGRAESEMDAGARAALVGAARRDVRDALVARPRWGAGWVMAGYLDEIAGDNGLPAFERSYRFAPYLRREAMWRIGFAVRHWRHLPRETRAAVLEEAGWLARRSGRDKQRVHALLGTSAAATSFQIRFRAGPEAKWP